MTLALTKKIIYQNNNKAGTSLFFLKSVRGSKADIFYVLVMGADMNSFFRHNQKQIVGKNIASADQETDSSPSPKCAI